MPEPTEMPFDRQICVSPRNHVLDDGTCGCHVANMSERSLLIIAVGGWSARFIKRCELHYTTGLVLMPHWPDVGSAVRALTHNERYCAFSVITFNSCIVQVCLFLTLSSSRQFVHNDHYLENNWLLVRWSELFSAVLCHSNSWERCYCYGNG